jgi:hypothetical protein
MLHIRTLLSSLALATKSPSGDHATSETPAVWPVKFALNIPSVESHSLTVLSAPALATIKRAQGLETDEDLTGRCEHTPVGAEFE